MVDNCNVGSVVVVSNYRMKNVKAWIYDISFGDVALCIGDDGNTFSAHKNSISPFVGIPTVAPELPAATPQPEPKVYHNTIKKKKGTSIQKNLFR